MRQQIAEDIRAWDAIGIHRTGTAEDHATATWLAETLRQAGLAPDVRAFPFHRRVLGRCDVAVGDQLAEGVPLFDGGYTSEAAIAAPIVPFTNAVPYGAVALTTFTPYGAHPANANLNAARQSTAAAIVAVADERFVRDGIALLNAEAWDAPYGPPVLQVATAHQAWLSSAAAEGAVANLRAHVRLEATEASNVQATVPGTEPDLAPVVIMTPRSSWWHSTSERGGGIAAWLACARAFAAQPGRRTAIFTANTGHELNHVGLDHWLAETPELVAGAYAWVHLGANFAARDAELRLQASDSALMTALQSAFQAHEINWSATTPVGDAPLGEARNIHDGDGRYVSLLARNPLFHHPADRWPDAVDMDLAEATTLAMLDLTRQLADD